MQGRMGRSQCGVRQSGGWELGQAGWWTVARAMPQATVVRGDGACQRQRASSFTADSLKMSSFCCCKTVGGTNGRRQRATWKRARAPRWLRSASFARRRASCSAPLTWTAAPHPAARHHVLPAQAHAQVPDWVQGDTLFPGGGAFLPEPFTLNLESYTLNRTPLTLHPKLYTLNPSP